jgi:hypothetical protein
MREPYIYNLLVRIPSTKIFKYMDTKNEIEEEDWIVPLLTWQNIHKVWFHRIIYDISIYKSKD